ncbi:MAG TPA: GNAT family N-acetyltransferase [Vicinamibacterales bacterium]|nr:GNAT family N-acetyltransferase [Vicinamibacterales bacterium]
MRRPPADEARGDAGAPRRTRIGAAGASIIARDGERAAPPAGAGAAPAPQPTPQPTPEPAPGGLVELGPADFARWDDFVERHPDGWICHLSDWLRTLEESFPHITGRVLASERDGALRAGIPVCEVRSRVLGTRLVSVPYGTLCCPLAPDDEVGRLMEGVLDLGRRAGARCIEVRAVRPLSAAAAERFARQARYTHHSLDVTAGAEALRLRLHRSCVRQRIDRALARGVVDEEAQDEGGLRAFYDLYVRCRKRLGLPPQPYRFIRSMWLAFRPQGRLEVRLASCRGTPIAGILLLRFNGRTSAEYLVSDDGRRHESPGHLLVWNAIRRSHELGCRVFDFGRTDAANEGLMAFKNRWGAQVTGLPVYYHPKSRLQAVESRRAALRSAGRVVFRRLPARANRWLGELIYRHAG